MRRNLLFKLLFAFSSLFVTSAVAQTYCTTGLYNSGCTYGDNLDDVTIGSFSQTATGCSTNGYGDYTSDTISISQSTPTAVGITSGYSSQWYAIWIDANNDGDFDDAGEHLWSSALQSGASGTVTSGSIVIDTSIATGTYRLRVRDKFSGTALLASQSCTNFSYGEVHDYTVSVLPPPSCPAPYSVVASNVTSSSATISWTGVGSAFVVQYDTTGFTLGMGDSVTSSTTSVSLTNLMPNTWYDVYVRNDCSGSSNGQSLWSGVATFKTGCVAFNVPFTEDFESTTSGSSSSPNPPSCWSFLRTNHGGLGYSYTRNYSTWANNSSQFWYTYTSSNLTYGDTMALISPEINDMDSVDMQLEFFARAGYSGASYDEVIYVGTMSDPTDLTTMTILDTVSVAGLLTYTNFLFYFDTSNGYNGTDKHIVIVPSSLTAYDYVMIDDITVEQIPACPKPLYPTFTNITDNSANLSFTSGGSKFVVEYGPCGFNQGTGMFDTSYTNSLVLTGLSSNTEYEAYIQSDCSGSGNGLSAWTQSSCFKTECSAIATPLSEDFESTTSGSSSNPTTPDCFKYTRTNNGGYGYGYTRNSSFYANSGSQFFYMYHSNTTDTMALVSPQIDSMDVNNKHIQFWARSTSSSRSEHLIVGTVSNPNSLADFTPIDSVDISSTTYQFFDVYVDPANGYNGSDMYIALVLWTGTSYTYGYAIIDDLSIEDIPQCTPSTGLAVSNITNTSALASWIPGDGGKFDIEYGETGFSQGTGAPLITGIVDSSYTLTGLLGNTCYDVYVRDSCSGNKSPWFGPITFCTPCDPVNAPITEDFEGVSGTGNSQNPMTPDCWNYWRNPNATYYGYTYSSLGPNGSYHFRFYQYNDQDTVALISPAIGNLSMGNKKVSFKNKSYYTSTSYQGVAMEVGTSPDYNTLRNSTVIDTVYGDYGQAYTNEFTVYLDTASGYNGTDQYVYMRPLFKSSQWYGYNLVDDIKIEDIPSCTPPWNVNVSNITSSSADLSWSSLSTGDFRVEYGSVGFTPATGQGTVISNTTSTTTMSGLTPNTVYEVYVADNCDTSLAGHSGPYMFQTECTSQLSGNYSVGGATADFPNLDSAIYVLSGCGINGAVTFNVAAGTDSATIALGNINGADSTNTVTIKGAGVSSTTLYINSSVGAGIDLDGTDYITFMDMTIDGSISQRPVWLHNNANHVTFDNCYVMGIPNSTSSATAVIVASSSPTTVSGSGENANHLTIMDCEISGGYYGISVYGSGSTSQGEGVHVENTEVHDVYYYGIRVHYMKDVNIVGNKVFDFTNTYSIAGYFYYISDYNIEKNELIASNYAVYLYRSNYLNTSAPNSTIVNNFFASTGTSYGMYGGYWENIDFYHNSISTTGSYGVYAYGAWTNVDMRNNIFKGGNNYAIYNSASSTNTSNIMLDNNLYYTGGGNVARWNTSTYASLAAWQAADTTMNANSKEGDPVFVANDDLRIIIGSLPNDAGDNTVGVNEDIFGTSRPFTGSTVVDMGAYEYEPLASDLELVDGWLTKGQCLSTMDTVMLEVKNVLGGTLDMSQTSVVANWDVSGPVNSNGTITVNTGSLPQDSILSMMATSVNLSVPGTYYLNAYLSPSTFNLSPINDTLASFEFTVNEVWKVTPESDTLYAATDTAELKVQSPYFGGNDFFITEICQYRTTSGAPTGGWPTWWPSAVDDYIEITGIPGSDLGGFTLEQWSSSAMVQTYTFPANTLIGPNGTAIIMVGQGASTSLADPNNYFYYGAGSSYIWSSGTLSGRIIKDAGGNIVDAVGYPGSSSTGYSFPATAGVSTSDWAGGAMGFTTSSTCGMRLEGADANGPTNWVASATSPQDPQDVNSSVTVPSPGSVQGFTWTLNGNLVDTVPVINVSHANSGIYHYIATYIHPCGPFVDTVTVYAFIPGSCVGPTNFMSTAECKEIVLEWDSDAATTASFIEYGLAGFTPGTGTIRPYVTSPDTVTGLTPNTGYEFYLVDSCANGVSSPIMVADSTTFTPTVADFGWTLNNVTMSSADVDFDASNTSNGMTYNWDFGDGNNGSGVTPTHTYSANGPYVVTLTVDGPCVNDTHIDTIDVGGIGIDEGMIGRTMNLYPNPTNGQFRVEFEVEGLEDVEISILSTVGQVVYFEKPGNISGTYQQTFDLSGQAAGVYLLRITTNDHVITRRVTLRR